MLPAIKKTRESLAEAFSDWVNNGGRASAESRAFLNAWKGV